MWWLSNIWANQKLISDKGQIIGNVKLQDVIRAYAGKAYLGHFSTVTEARKAVENYTRLGVI